MIVSTWEEMNPVRRSAMEDIQVVLPAGSWNDPGMSYLAIYDGHGGRDMVEFLRHALHHNVALELRDYRANNHARLTPNLNFNSCFDNTPTKKPTVDDMEQRLERAFLTTDIQAHKFGIQTSGSTVAMCLIHHATQTLYAANVGDSRIVFATRTLSTTQESESANDVESRQQKVARAIRLTHDHRADDPDEMKLIDEAGGFCLKGRVVGVLAVARSLGDFGLKPFVNSKPYTKVHNWTSQDPHSNGPEDFVILACDGLWDVLTDQQAVDIVCQSRQPKEQVAAELTQHAIRNGTTDNITVIVCWL